MTKYPYWFGWCLGVVSRVGITLPGAIRRMRCVNCGTLGIEQEACSTPFTAEWVAWSAMSTHRAVCGLPCGNGVSRELMMSELGKPVQARMIHNAGACPRCSPDGAV